MAIGTRHLGKVCILVLATLFSASPAAAAVAPDTDGLIVTDPLPGYQRIEGGKLDGPITFDTLMELTGTDSDEFPDELRGLPGEARTWRNDEGAIAVALVIDCGDVHAVSDFLQGALDSSARATDSTFESGVAGTAGFVVDQATEPARSVIWRQHTYFVEVLILGEPGDASEADIKALAASQAAFLQSSMGAAPTLNTSHSTAGSDSAAYLFGRIFGILVFLAIIAYMIWSIHRRKAERRALEALFAVPPLPFVSSARTPTALPPPPPPSPPSVP